MQRKKTKNQVAPGITIEVGGDELEDAMTSMSLIHFVIPLTGPEWREEDLMRAFDEADEGRIRTIEGLRRFLAALPDAGPNEGALSKGVFLQSARRGLSNLDEVTSRVPIEQMPVFTDAINQGFRLGALITEMRLRERHLTEVTREKVLQEGRRKGGDNRLGKVDGDTKEMVKFMRMKIQQGKTMRQAAELAVRKKYGASAEANRQKFRYWEKKGFAGL